MSSSNVDDADLEIGPPNEAVATELCWRPPSANWIRFAGFAMATTLLACILAVGGWGAVTGNVHATAWSDSNKLWAWILEYVAAAHSYGESVLASVLAKLRPKLHTWLRASG